MKTENVPLRKFMKKPLGNYDMENNESNCGDYSKVAWAAIVDNRYKCEVQRTEPYKGVLVVFDGKNNDEILHEVSVPISYNAQFGADIIDVAQWQDIAIQTIDNP